MWRQSFQHAINLSEQNQHGDLHRQLDYFCGIDPSAIRVAIDGTTNTIAGFMVLAASELDHLYIDLN